jgi:hypothetical protein
MGYVTYSLGMSEYAEIHRLEERCDWPKCNERARWGVEAKRHVKSLVGGLFCTTHARAVKRKIERIGAEQFG